MCYSQAGRFMVGRQVVGRQLYTSYSATKAETLLRVLREAESTKLSVVSSAVLVDALASCGQARVGRRAHIGAARHAKMLSQMPRVGEGRHVARCRSCG